MAAITLRQEGTILFNSEGPFANPRLSVYGVRFNYGLGDEDLRALLLLHELGHLLGIFKSDAQDAIWNRDYTKTVLAACFQ